jgi:hypothetical protein
VDVHPDLDPRPAGEGKDDVARRGVRQHGVVDEVRDRGPVPLEFGLEVR